MSVYYRRIVLWSLNLPLNIIHHYELFKEITTPIIILSLGTTTYICDFHLEQCWERWLRKTDNGLNNQREEVLQLLRNVAKSSTEDAYEDNLRSLQTTEVWLSNPQLRNWFEKTWLIEAKVQ